MLRREKACIKEFYLNNRRGLVDINGCVYLDGRYAGILKSSGVIYIEAVSYTHLTLPTTLALCRSRWSPYH